MPPRPFSPPEKTSAHPFSADDAKQWLAAIVESSDDAIISKDLNGVIRSWNAGAQRLFGYTAQEVIGLPVTILIPADRREEETDILDRIRRGERVEHFETLRRRRDGTCFEVSLMVSPVRDTDGHVIGASKIARDITDRKVALAAVRLSEERFRLFTNHAPVGIFLSDAAGRCTFVNDRWCEMTGLDPARAGGAGWAEAVHPADRARVVGGWQEAVAAGAPSLSEFRFLRPDGRVVWVQGHAVRVRPEPGAQSYLGSCIDITARKEAELQAAFLHQLSDQLAGLTDPDQIMDVAQAALGEHLGANRCYFFEMIQEENLAMVRRDWRTAGLPPTAGNHPLDQFGSPEFLAWLAKPRAAITDVMTHPVTRDRTGGYTALKMRALATSTFSKDGRRMLSLAVSTSEPREWLAPELDLIENVTARVWPAIERARALHALQESDQLYRAIGESINYGIWVCDAEGRNTYASDSFLELVGLTQEECSRRGWGAVLRPDEVEATSAAWAECVRTGKAWEREHHFKGTDGRWHPVLARGVPIRDATGRITRWVGFNLDIAERERAQDTDLFLGRLSHRLGLLTDPLDILHVASAEIGRHLDVDRCGFAERSETDDTITISGDWACDQRPRLAGTYPITEFADSPVWRAQVDSPLAVEDTSTHPLTRERRENFQRIGLGSLLLAPFVRDGRWPITLVAGCDRPRHWEAHELDLVGKALDRVRPIVEQTRSAHALQAVERAIRESEHQLRLVTDHAPIFLAQIDRGHRFKFVNRTYAERYGLTREEIIGRHVSDITGVGAYETFRLHMDATLGGRRSEFEQEIPYATLGRRWVHVIYEPERATAGGEVMGLVAVVVDITARKQAELELEKARDDALSASRAKDDFLAALSHELRTPLSPVLLVASDAANNPALPREIRETFDMIRGNISLEARLIDDLLDLTRITRGKMSLEKHAVDVHAVLHDALANIRAEIDAKAMILELSLTAESATITGDAVRVQQVLWNILKNAVKFTSDGGRIRVGTRVAGEILVVEIADNGIGMSAGELGGVFEAFAQGEHSRTSAAHRFGGLGLGLAIARKLIELHAGRIYARSPGRGHGSIFTLELPLRSPTRADSAAPALADSVPPAPAAAGSILLVEDHPSTRATLQKLLSRRNYEVVPAATAKEARQLAAARHFDFLLSDVGLPDGDGYQLMSELKRMQPSLRGIAVSGYGMEDDLQRSRAAGFAAHLVKPVSIAALEKAFGNLAKPPA